MVKYEDTAEGLETESVDWFREEVRMCRDESDTTEDWGRSSARWCHGGEGYRKAEWRDSPE